MPMQERIQMSEYQVKSTNFKIRVGSRETFNCKTNSELNISDWVRIELTFLKSISETIFFFLFVFTE